MAPSLIGFDQMWQFLSASISTVKATTKELDISYTVFGGECEGRIIVILFMKTFI